MGDSCNMTKKNKKQAAMELEMEEEDVNTSFFFDSTHFTNSKECRY